MAIKLKTKLGLGLSFLFIVILTYGILAIFYINRLSGDAEKVLKNNYESLVYCNNMLKSLEDIPGKKEAIQLFDNNLSKQENNITEIGEREATQTLRRNFSALLSNPVARSTMLPYGKTSYVSMSSTSKPCSGKMPWR